MNEDSAGRRSTPQDSGRAHLQVFFDPGVVRVGAILLRDGPAFDVEFPRNQRETLSVGAQAQVAMANEPTPGRLATVAERSENGNARRYRLVLQRDDAAAALARVADRSPRPTHSLDILMRFGRLDFRGKLVAPQMQGALLQVSQETETVLRAADAIELVVRAGEADRDARLVGWIDRRILDGAVVRYEFRIDDRLTEDAAAQRARLRTALQRTDRGNSLGA